MISFMLSNVFKSHAQRVSVVPGVLRSLAMARSHPDLFCRYLGNAVNAKKSSFLGHVLVNCLQQIPLVLQIPLVQQKLFSGISLQRCLRLHVFNFLHKTRGHCPLPLGLRTPFQLSSTDKPRLSASREKQLGKHIFDSLHSLT